MHSLNRRAALFGTAMVGALAASQGFKPRHAMVAEGEVNLEENVPTSFGDWKYVPSPMAQVDLAVRRDENDATSLVYDQVLTRSYRNARGETVMLALAWGRQQRQEVKIHRPELCYIAQGFKVDISTKIASLSNAGFEANTLLASAPRRLEPVVYWIRIGETISRSAWQTRLYILSEGLRGRIPDGILVRSSQVVASSLLVERSRELQSAFLRELVAAMPADKRSLLVPNERQDIALGSDLNLNLDRNRS